MPMRRHVVLAALATFAFAAPWPVLAQADGLALLGQFLQTTRGGRAQFVQQVTLPAKAGQSARQRQSSGTLEFQRPGRFRFAYKKPFEQTLVADGQTLWLYDLDLQQVTARSQAQVLGSTPLALIIAATDVGGLQKDFALQAQPARDGLQWVRATPRGVDAEFREARFGFVGLELRRLEIDDRLGQRVTLAFRGGQRNPVIPSGVLRFDPPAGADLIGKPLP